MTVSAEFRDFFRLIRFSSKLMGALDEIARQLSES
jgi:hypothetical protein